MKIKNIIITALIPLLGKPCAAQEMPQFYGIQEGHIQRKSQMFSNGRSILDSVQMNGQAEEVASTDKSASLDQIEDMICRYEQSLKRKRASKEEKVYSFYMGEERELTIPNLIKVMGEVGLSNKLFVLAQAILETGHFSSRVCRENHNLFGLTNPKTHNYYKFLRWEDSVIGYQKFIQYRYKGGNYLDFLKRIGYAESPTYTHNVAKLARQLYEQMCAEGTL